MDDLLMFWNYVNETWDADEVAVAAEDCEFDTERFTASNLASLSSAEIDEAFSELIDFVMDAMGVDNYGDIHDMLADIGLSESRIDELLS